MNGIEQRDAEARMGSSKPPTLAISIALAVYGASGPGGIGVVLSRGEQILKTWGRSAKAWEELENVTVGRAALLALLAGLRLAQSTSELAVVRTPIEFVAKGVNEWLPGWQKRGWKKADGHPVLHADLWQQAADLLFGVPVVLTPKDADLAMKTARHIADEAVSRSMEVASGPCQETLPE